MGDSEANESIVEGLLMKFQDIPPKDKLKLNVFLIEIDNIGAWFLKFRKTGVIVNHRELISDIQVDATIAFKTVSSFFRIMEGGSTISDEVNKSRVTMTGSAEAIESFRCKVLRVCDLPNILTNDFITRPAVRLQSWRYRYFVVYPDRLDYFVDQYDATPKATLSLVDVEVQPVKRVNMPGTGEHWGFIVTTKNPKTTFRLSSELTGVEGQAECAAWEKVFMIARNSCEQFLDAIVTDSDIAKFKRKDDVRSVVEALAKTAATGGSPLRRGGASVGDGSKSREDGSSGWFEYFTSKQGAPRLLLVLGITVLLVRVAWNVTKIRLMLRTILFHSLVAVALCAALFFVKGVFSDYFSSDEGSEGVDTASLSTIVTNSQPPTGKVKTKTK